MAKSLKVRRALVNGDFDSCAFFRVLGSFSESADNNQGLISKSDIFKQLFTEKFFSETKNHFSPMPFVTKFRFCLGFESWAGGKFLFASKKICCLALFPHFHFPGFTDRPKTVLVTLDVSQSHRRRGVVVRTFSVIAGGDLWSENK